MKNLEKEDLMKGKLTVLEKESYDMPTTYAANIVIVGLNLWSRIRDDQSSLDIGDKKDGKEYIKDNSIKTHNQCFQSSLKWLKDEVLRLRNEDRNRRILVVTHYAPTIRGSAQPDKDGVGNQWSAYQNDILGGEGVEGLQLGDVWLFGHTHFSTQFYQDDVWCVSNQRSVTMSDEFEDLGKTGFNIEATIEI